MREAAALGAGAALLGADLLDGPLAGAGAGAGLAAAACSACFFCAVVSFLAGALGAGGVTDLLADAAFATDETTKGTSAGAAMRPMERAAGANIVNREF